MSNSCPECTAGEHSWRLMAHIDYRDRSNPVRASWLYECVHCGCGRRDDVPWQGHARTGYVSQADLMKAVEG